MAETPEQAMTRVILQIIRECGRCHNGFGNGDADGEHNDLSMLIETEYRRARVEYDWKLEERCLAALIAGRRVRKIHGRWEDEVHYELRQAKRRKKREPQLF